MQQYSQQKQERYTLYLGFGLAAVYACLVCWSGVPGLRHDWAWPRDHYAFLDLIVNSTSGWGTQGIGAPSPYPGAYLVGTVLGAAGLMIGSFPTLAIFVLSIGVLITLGARTLAGILGASSFQTATLEIFALFNPWVYNKTVAGHLYMLLAYGACFMILFELMRRTTRTRHIVLLLALTLAQLQFFVIAMVAVAIHALSRRIVVPFVSGVILAMPIWVGLIFDRASLLTTPYTLAWESSQSVDPMSALVLTGYFANYTAHYAGIQIAAEWVFASCVVVAVALARRRAATVAVALVLFLWIVVTGTRGILGPAYTNIVLHIPESGFFRELYDLLAFVAISYCVMLASVPRSRTFTALSSASLAASIVVASAWFTWPPSKYWVPIARVPNIKINSAPNTRFALYPAYQPMEFLGMGSGADPDLYARPHGVTPINEYIADYPINVALSSFGESGDARRLTALSTGLIVKRPWLSTNAFAIGLQMSGVPPSVHAKTLTYRPLQPLPEVTLGQYPQVGSLVNLLGAGNLFFADARTINSPNSPPSWPTWPQFFPVQVSNALVDDRQGWTDARFRFAAEPNLGQGLGGAVTTSSSAVLPIRSGMWTLVNIQGMLLSEANRIVQRRTRGYEWVSLPDNVSGLRCKGECVVVGQATFRVPPPLNPAPRKFWAVAFAVITPWLVRVDVPANAPPTLRYNVAFDPNWTAVSQGFPTTHIRLDSTVNGWLLAHSTKPYTVYLVHWVSLAQALVEFAAVVWVGALVFYRRPLAATRKERVTASGQGVHL